MMHPWVDWVIFGFMAFILIINSIYWPIYLIWKLFKKDPT